MCDEVRPVCHRTLPLPDRPGFAGAEPVKLKPWAVALDDAAYAADGRVVHVCDRCAAHRTSSAASSCSLFSGIRTTLDADLSAAEDVIRHNDMHFPAVPPFLANLTMVEKVRRAPIPNMAALP